MNNSALHRCVVIIFVIKSCDYLVDFEEVTIKWHEAHPFFEVSVLIVIFPKFAVI